MALAEGADIVAMDTRQNADKALALEECFKALSPEALSEIVLINGPGNFTSLRAALGFARALALGFGVASLGIGVFDVDAELFKVQKHARQNATLYRDARGGRFYEAVLKNGEISAIGLTKEMRASAYSFEDLEGASVLGCTKEARMGAAAALAEGGAGTCPAQAFYVRPPDAALPSEKPLVILDDE